MITPVDRILDLIYSLTRSIMCLDFSQIIRISRSSLIVVIIEEGECADGGENVHLIKLS